MNFSFRSLADLYAGAFTGTFVSWLLGTPPAGLIVMTLGAIALTMMIIAMVREE